MAPKPIGLIRASPIFLGGKDIVAVGEKEQIMLSSLYKLTRCMTKRFLGWSLNYIIDDVDENGYVFVHSDKSYS